MAFEGEISILRMEDLVPISDRSRVRHGGRGADRYIRSDEESEADEPKDPRSMKWKERALDELASGSSKRIAAVALDAIEKIQRARDRNKNLQSPVSHDIRVAGKVARQACLTMCQFVSRFSADQRLAAEEALSAANAKAGMEQEIFRLKNELQIQRISRQYLLQRSRERSREYSREPSREVSPVVTAARSGRGTKRNVHEKRGEPPAGDPRLCRGPRAEILHPYTRQ